MKNSVKLLKFPKLLKSLMLATLVGWLLTSLLPNHAFASETSFSVSPSLLRIQTTSGATVSSPVTITNLSDQSKTIYIIIKHFLPSDGEDGTIRFPNGNQVPYGKRPHLIDEAKILDGDKRTDGFILAPNQKKTVTLSVSVPKNEPSSDYYFSLLFLTKASIGQSDELSNTINIKAITNITTGIGTNVLLGVNQNSPSDAIIDQFDAPTVLQHGPVTFTIKIKNMHDHFISVDATIRITDMFGKTVAHLSAPDTDVLGMSSRYLSSMQWSEPILFGPYEATLTLSSPQSKKIYTRSLHFIAVPIVPLAVISGIFLAGILFVARKK